MTVTSIAILGGGPGGLMTSYLLQQRARARLDITIFEAGPRLGGKIITPRFESAPVAYEAGAAELYDYSRLGPDPLRDLIAELGLTTRPMSGGTVVLDDKFLKTEADIRRELGDESWKALARFNRRARAAIGPADYYESDWKADNDDPLASRTFRALLARIPDAAARRYVEVAVHSDLATEPHLTSAMYGLQNYLMDTPNYMRLYTIDGGIEQLPKELAKRLSARVRLQEPVVRVEKAANDRYRVWSNRDGKVVGEEFEFVVVALPNNWIPAIEWGGEELAVAMYHHHRHYDYPAHYLRVSVLFEKPFWRDRISDSYFMLDAFGGCCVYDESSRNGADSHGVLGWLLAGDAALNLGNSSDAELVDAVLDSLPRCLRHGRKWFLEGQVHRWANSVNGLPGGFPAHEPDSRHQPEPVHHDGLFVVGDYLFDSTINGVLDSADVVAEWILEEVAELAPLPQANGSKNGHGNGSPIPDGLKLCPIAAHRAMSAVPKPPANASQAVPIRRIRFLPRAPAGSKPLRSFAQPRSCVAVAETVIIGSLPPASWPEPTDQLDVVLVPAGGGEPGPGWLAPPEHPDAPAAVTVRGRSVTVEWRPGRAVVRGPADRFDEMLAALAEFAFYEGELRSLESAVEAGEATAAADTAMAYRIRSQNRLHWPRFAALIEQFGRNRLAYARLEPRLSKASGSLPPLARGLVNRLLAKADVESRMESLSNRLEACEDLYEGATDRVADYRWYRTGHWLEWGIIFLLLLEVAVMLADLYLRYLDSKLP